MYAIFTGEYNLGGYLRSVYDKKKDAIKDIRAKGYKYNKEQDIYLNAEIGRWYKIEKSDRNEI